MSAQLRATVHEHGNGLADPGDYVTEQGELYEVVRVYGPIHTGRSCGEGNYQHAIVEPADWDDVEDDNEPVCSCVVDVDAETEDQS